jgi:hypothetical protein
MLLLICAASSHAECAWVLWESNVLERKAPQHTLDRTEKAVTQSSWEAKSAFLQLDECRKAMEETITQITAKTTGEVSRSHDSGEVTLLASHPPKEGIIALDVYRFRCLPDTVKPKF